MSNPRSTLAQLRGELEQLARSLTGVTHPPNPDHYTRDGKNPGPEWHVPINSSRWSWFPHIVRVIDGEPGVFTEGGAHAMTGDLEFLTSDQARLLGWALIAAADWADGQDEIGKHRTQRGKS